MNGFAHEQVVTYLRSLVGNYVEVTPWASENAAVPIAMSVCGEVREVVEHEWYWSCLFGEDPERASRFYVPTSAFVRAHIRFEDLQSATLRIVLKGPTGVLDIRDSRIALEGETWILPPGQRSESHGVG